MGLKPSKENLELQYEQEMTSWELEMYRDNPYLYYIPELAKERKRKEIRKRLGLEA
jgi:hypothetical protein